MTKQAPASNLPMHPDNLDTFGNCPKCNRTWGYGDMYETYLGQDWWKSQMTQKELYEQYRGKKWSHLIGIEIQGMYDGVCQWKCPFCETRWNRFTGEEMRVKYHLIKGTRMYHGFSYNGASSNNQPTDSETLFQALEFRKILMARNPGVGWDIYEVGAEDPIDPEDYRAILNKERGLE